MTTTLRSRLGLKSKKGRDLMSIATQSLSRLSYNELNELLSRSSILEGSQAESFADALKEVALYSTESHLQIAHSRSILQRMEASSDFEECLTLSHIQESLPLFYISLTLRHIFARGLIIAASKRPSNPTYRRALAHLFNLPGFSNCPILQCHAAELLLAAIKINQNLGEKKELHKQIKLLPGMAYSSELQAISEKASRIIERGGQDSVVKIDLNQLMLAPINKLKRFFGMGDFRMRVEFRGLERYEQAVVKVPAFSEKAARQTAGKFIANFLKNELGSDSKSAKILDIFPPGSSWESGRHPMLKLT